MPLHILGSMSGIMSNRHFWLVVVIFAIGIVLHYPQQILGIDSPSLFSSLGLTRHAIERVFFLLPVTYAGFVFGIKVGLASLAIASAIILPRVFLISLYLPDALFEASGIIVIGGIVNLWFHMYQREQERSRVTDALLKAEEEKWRNSFNALEDVMLIIDKGYNIENINDNGLALLGKSRDEVIGKKCYRIMTGRDSPIEECPCRRTLETKQVESFDWYEERFGRYFSIKSAPIFDENGEIVKLVDLRRDITGLKSTEGMLVKIIDGSSIPTFVINKQHKVTHWNTALESLSAIKKEEIIGTDGQWGAFYPEKRPVMADLIVNRASTSEIEVHYPGRYRENGLIAGAYEAEDWFPALGMNGRWLHFTASPIKDNSGEVIGAIETLEDITERKSAEENLRHYLQEITRAQEEERKRIARELHDDTAQDLLVLSRQLDSFVVSAIDHLSTEDISYLERLRQQAEGILDGVHRFSQDLRPSVLDDLGLVPALEWLASDLTNHFEAAIALEVLGSVHRFSPELELILFRIAQEALRNMWKHSEASKAWVTVEFGDDKTVLTVKDNGKGFELPERIEDLAVAGKLGLVGMQERAQLIGGRLTLQSEPGKGTTVTVEVPI